MQVFRWIVATSLVLAAGVVVQDAPSPDHEARAKQEAADRAKQMRDRLFQQMDANSDGKISRGEFTSYPDYFDRLDADTDGSLVRREISGGLANLLNKNLPYLAPPRSSTGLVPLSDLASGTYHGKEGGLYPGGRNERPPAHEAAGMRQARLIRPVDAQGQPASGGKIVLLSIGMSNTTMEFSVFKPLGDAEPGKNPSLAIVDAAQSGMTARTICLPESERGKQFWDTIDERLSAAGLSRAQVQVAWMKQADGNPGETKFPDYAVALENEMQQIAQILQQRFANLKLLYLSSRIYAGYAVTPLNPEPFAYEGGFSNKWLIEKQIAGDRELNFDPARPTEGSLAGLGPYLWADGTKGRSDGLTYAQADVASDGTHPSAAGSQKVARQLLDFFKSDSTAKLWFLEAGR